MQILNWYYKTFFLQACVLKEQWHLLIKWNSSFERYVFASLNVSDDEYSADLILTARS